MRLQRKMVDHRAANLKMGLDILRAFFRIVGLVCTWFYYNKKAVTGACGNVFISPPSRCIEPARRRVASPSRRHCRMHARSTRVICSLRLAVSRLCTHLRLPTTRSYGRTSRQAGASCSRWHWLLRSSNPTQEPPYRRRHSGACNDCRRRDCTHNQHSEHECSRLHDK